MVVVREVFTRLGFDVDNKSIMKAETAMRGIQNTAELAATAFVAAGAAAAAFALNAAGEFEQMEISFETMLGSADEAKKFLDEMATIAKTTPFELQDVNQNAKLLLAMGIETDKVGQKIVELGNISAGLSVPLSRIALNFGQVRVQGKLTGRELRDFAVSGVPLLDQLSKQLGKSKSEVQDMISAGKIGFPEVEKAFTAMSSEGGKFANLMEKQSKSLFGIISNFQDIIFLLAKDIGKKLLPRAKEFIESLIELIEANRELIKQRVAEWIEKVIWVFDKLNEAVTWTIKNFYLFKDAVLISIGVLTTLIGLIAIMNAGFLLIPSIILLTAAAIGLIVDDIDNWVRGQESLLGDLIGPVKIFAQEWKKLEKDPVWGGIYKILGTLRQMMLDLILDRDKLINSFASGLEDLEKSLKKFTKTLKNTPIIGDLIQSHAMYSRFMQKAFTHGAGRAGTMDISRQNEAIFQNRIAAAQARIEQIRQQRNERLRLQNNINSNVTVNVSTSGGVTEADADVIATRVEEGVKKAVQDGVNSATTGGAQ
jgi:tape measure domain-containing protein